MNGKGRKSKSITRQPEKMEPDFVFDSQKIAANQQRLELVFQHALDSDQCTLYDTLKFRGVNFNIGDLIELYDTSLKSAIVCRLLKIVECRKPLEKHPFLQVELFLKKSHLPSNIQLKHSKYISEAEIFESKIVFCVPIEAVKSKCFVLTMDQYSSMTHALENYYFQRAKYDLESESLIPGVD